MKVLFLKGLPGSGKTTWAREFCSQNKDWVRVNRFDCDLDECIKRDLRRSNSVGKDVILKMYNDYLKPKVEQYCPKLELQNCIICDLDGTLALFGDKNPYERDFENDILNKTVALILQNLTDNLIILSGRSDKFQIVTEEWLAKNDVFYRKLYMRKEGDVRRDCVVKKEMFDFFIKNRYSPILILDDRNQVVELWRSMGLTCFQVADGNF